MQGILAMSMILQKQVASYFANLQLCEESLWLWREQVTCRVSC